MAKIKTPRPADRRDDVAPPPKLRRSSGRLLVGLGLVLLSVLLAVWVFTQVKSTKPVLALRTTVNEGQVIQRGDLVVVEVGADPALSPVPSGSIDSVVGKRATGRLPAGSLLVEGSVSDGLVPAKGNALVQVPVGGSMLPADAVGAGDKVRLVLTAGNGGDGMQEAKVAAPAPARVVTVRESSDGQSSVVTVEMPDSSAQLWTVRAAQGRVAIIVDSKEQ